MDELSASELAALLSGSATVASLAKDKGVSESDIAARTEATLRRALERKRPAPLRAAGTVAALVLAVAVARVAYAQTCTPDTRAGGLWLFCAGSPAQAAEVNDNFSQLRTWTQQTASLLGVSALTPDGGAFVQGSPGSFVGLNVTGGATVSGGVNVGGSANIGGNAVVQGGLSVTGGLSPDWDSTWVASPGNADVTLTHNLGVVPSHVQVWYRDNPSATWNMPVMTYDEGSNLVNGPTYAISSSQLRFRVRARPISFFHYTGAGTYEEAVLGATTGQYRFLLWK